MVKSEEKSTRRLSRSKTHFSKSELSSCLSTYKTIVLVIHGLLTKMMKALVEDFFFLWVSFVV
jgi:hypothetical protein